MLIVSLCILRENELFILNSASFMSRPEKLNFGKSLIIPTFALNMEGGGSPLLSYHN